MLSSACRLRGGVGHHCGRRLRGGGLEAFGLILRDRQLGYSQLGHLLEVVSVGDDIVSFGIG
jgi:hypothetical protein